MQLTEKNVKYRKKKKKNIGSKTQKIYHIWRQQLT